jgi:uncharacterized membrane protein
MKALRRILLDGAMVVLPTGAIVLLVLAIVHRLQHAAAPLAGRFLHPVDAAVILLILLCAVAGLLVRSAPGRWARTRLESAVFQRIPGYRLLRAFVADGIPGAEAGHQPQPALARIEEGLCPALIMDRCADGRLAVFVPATPSPMSGALYVFAADRVLELDVPLLPFLKAISSWGLGLRELIGPQAGASRRSAGAEAD